VVTGNLFTMFDIGHPWQRFALCDCSQVIGCIGHTCILVGEVSRRRTIRAQCIL